MDLGHGEIFQKSCPTQDQDSYWEESSMISDRR